MAAYDKDKFDKDKEIANESSLKGAAQLREEQNKRDLEAYIAEKRKEDQMRYSKWLDELRNKHKTTSSKTGKESTYWDELNDLADAVINAEQNAYNDWRSNMMSLLNLFSKLNKAANISADQVAGEAWDRVKNPREESWGATKLLGGVINSAGEGYIGFKSKMLHKIKGDGEFNLPALEHKVTFKDGKVEIADLTRADGVPLDKQNQANQAFKTFVGLWLMENDYVPVKDKQGEFQRHPNGEVLDEDTFKKLNADPKTSLATFLKDNANLKYEEQDELQSRTSPTPP